jgi:cell division protein FtsQ
MRVRATRTRRRTTAKKAPIVSWKLPRPGRRELVALSVLVAVGAFAVGLRAAWDRAAEMPFFAVREVEIVGATHATSEEIRAMAGVEVGASWLALDSGRVRFRVNAHPWVERARVARPWFGTVRIAITESRPVARLELGGRTLPLTDDVRVLPGLVEDDVLLPVIRGVKRGGSVDEAALERAIVYVRELKLQGLGELAGVEIDLSAAGDRIRLRDRGFLASVESPIEPRAAIQNVVSFLETLDGEGGAHGTLRLISLGTAVWDAG